MQPFPRLPEELVKLVFECACEPVDVASSSTSSVPANVNTLLSLLLVSRASYNLLISHLYRTVTISKPSQLISFTSTLLQRPTLGLLVRNLWVGVAEGKSSSLPIIVSSNIHCSRAAQNHITRHKGEEYQQGITESYQECKDLVYLEDGIEFAAMYVQSRTTTHMAHPNSPHLGRYFHNLPSISHVPFGELGVDRDSAGYDASGDWIGMDEWVLRCIELQNMAEFHWEWVAVTSSKEQYTYTTGDEEAKKEDPMDWADVNVTPAALPSFMQLDRDMRLETGPSSPLTSSTLGFDHLLQFSLLRKRGHSSQSAAFIIIENFKRNSNPSQISSDHHSNIHLLHDSSETDHFAHPALYARSGCIELLIGCEPPEGENAPPNAIPASSAVFSAFGGMSYSSDSDSDSEEETAPRHYTNGNTLNLEGRQRERNGNALDFADLFGSVSHDSRSLYAGVMEPSADYASMGEDRATKAELNRPLPTLGSLIATMRACLSFCPRIRSLGLNGFLERVVGGTRECVGLSELRHLCLGPAPPFWSSALHLHQKTLSNIRTLHISGCMLYLSEAKAIGGYTSALPNLREFEWTLWLGHVTEHPLTVVDALSYILGHGPTSASASSSQKGEAIQRKRPMKSIRATLNAADVTFWQQNAKEEARKDARLILQEINTKEQDANIRSVREWWERKARIR